MLASRDKLWHFLASLGMVWIFVGSFSVVVNRCFPPPPHDTGTAENSGDGTCSANAEKQGSNIEQDAARQDEEKQELHVQPSASQQEDPPSESRRKRQSICCQRLFQPPGIRLALASFLSFLVGAAKEIADVLWNGWPWCSNGVCTGDGWDIVANIIGIGVGASVLLVVLQLVTCVGKERGK